MDVVGAGADPTRDHEAALEERRLGQGRGQRAEPLARVGREQLADPSTRGPGHPAGVGVELQRDELSARVTLRLQQIGVDAAVADVPGLAPDRGEQVCGERIC